MEADGSTATFLGEADRQVFGPVAVASTFWTSGPVPPISEVNDNTQGPDSNTSAIEREQRRNRFAAST